MTKKLSDKYDAKTREKFWQNHWAENKIYKFKNDKSREQTFVIDTPPPTVSGVLHMGHVFSYTQADFVARFQRMSGKDVFYPMGFDDNGLPTERLVEKIIEKKATVFEAENGHGSFVNKCREIVENCEKEFEALFNAIALSVDWDQKYQTISPEVQKISQASFVDLFNKGLVYRSYKPVIWDCADQTALSQADLEDKEVLSKANFINFESEDGDKIEIMTTRPELLPACVALLLNPNHSYAKKINASKEGRTGKFAYSAVFQVKVPIIIDFDVKIDEENAESNITGAVMCCTYGDENDVKWVQKYRLGSRVILANYDGFDKDKFNNIFAEIDDNDDNFTFSSSAQGIQINIDTNNPIKKFDYNKSRKICGVSPAEDDEEKLKKTIYFDNITGKSFKIKQARENIIKFLAGELNDGFDIDSSLRAQRGNPETYLTRPSKEIKQNKKIAERSKSEIEYLEKEQWFIKVLPFKEEIKKQIEKCAWHPEYMKVRALQWCENLNSDWCVSRQRFFGVPIPAWDALPKHQKIPKPDLSETVEYENGEIKITDTQRCNEAINEARDKNFDMVVADFCDLPIDPRNFEDEKNLDKIFKIFERNGFLVNKEESKREKLIIAEKDNNAYFFYPETNILDTWATSSISPQISSKGISSEIVFDKARHEKLFPADLRPQAHEIIRTWAFYTIVKAYLHSLDGSPRNSDELLAMTSKESELPAIKGDDNSIPWKNLMISGWCLAADKTKMSKSKGNVVTPTSLIEEKGCDIVRYWASTSHLGADTAYSEDVFKIGQKLVTKLFNAAKFCSMNFSLMQADAKVTEASDLWILSRLHETTKKATQEFEKFEYARAREQIEEFFWHDFCDNYLEICKVRSYGLMAEKLAGLELSESEKAKIIQGQQSAILTLKTCLNILLKLFAPFIPHICDEIYAVIFAEEFAQTKSISARGNWPKFDEIKFDKETLELGNAALEIIFEVRKFKSEQNISMKTTVKKIKVNSTKNLADFHEDLKNVCNALEIKFVNSEKFVEVELN